MLVSALTAFYGPGSRRTLLLSWPMLFQVPVLLLVYFDARHLAPASAALLATALPPLFELSFYRAIWQRPNIALIMAGVCMIGSLLVRWADQALLASESWRYWTPLLDPARFAWYLG